MMIPNSLQIPLAQSLIALAENINLRNDLEETLREFCHQCRNRLNSLKLGLYLARRQASKEMVSDWELLEKDYLELETQIDRVQLVCRPMTLSLVTICINLLFRDRQEGWSRVVAKYGHTLRFEPASVTNVASFDVLRLGAALDALVEWRAKQGGAPRTIAVRWWVDPGHAHIAWSEATAGRVVTRPDGDDPQSLWILPQLIRVVMEHGGEVVVDDGDGWNLQISWPQTGQAILSEPVSR